jgi:hypothetical protein
MILKVPFRFRNTKALSVKIDSPSDKVNSVFKNDNHPLTKRWTAAK